MTRRVFGRVRGVEAHGKIWKVELTKAGLRVRQRSHRRVDVVPFDRLCNGGAVERTLPSGEQFSFALADGGLEVRQGGRRPKLVPWETLANFGRTQMEMFPPCKSDSL